MIENSNKAMVRLLILCISIFLTTTNVYTQQRVDVLELENGTIYRGEIVKKGTEVVSINTVENALVNIQLDQVVKMYKEYYTPDSDLDYPEIKFSNYGGDISTGFALGGGGVLGFPMRFYFDNISSMELGFYLRPILLSNEDTRGNTTNSLKLGAMFTGGPVAYFSRKYDPLQGKVKQNGIFFKGGYGISRPINEYLFAIGWSYRSFKENSTDSSFTMELGPGFLSGKFKNDYSGYERRFGPIIIFWKLQWNYYHKR